MSTFGTRIETRPVKDWYSEDYQVIPYTNPRLSLPTAVTLTANSSAHTFGAWTEVIASLPDRTSMLNISVGSINATTVNTASVISIGIGPSGSETELFYYAVGSAALQATTSTFPLAVNIVVPVALTSGTRIAARLQSLVTGGKTATIQIQTVDAVASSMPNLPSNFDSLGVSLATSRGTNIAASSAYTEIVASTSNPYRGLIVVPSAGNANMSAISGSTMTVAVGPSGSEIDIGTILYQTGNAELVVSPINMFFPFNIPVNSRIAVKQSANTTTVDASVIGVHI